jgi:Tetratricopeptide repeat
VTLLYCVEGGYSPYCATRLQTTETIETIETKQPAVYVSLKRIETNTVSIHHCVQVLEKRKSVLGPEDLDTLTSMANLSYTWKRQGRDSDALALLEACVHLRNQ